MNWLRANDATTSTGRSDSIHVSIDDIRTVNAKLIELNYEKEINDNLRSIIKNDSTIIKNLRYEYNSVSTKNAKLTKERNLAVGGGALFMILFLLKLL